MVRLALEQQVARSNIQSLAPVVLLVIMLNDLNGDVSSHLIRNGMLPYLQVQVCRPCVPPRSTAALQLHTPTRHARRPCAARVCVFCAPARPFSDFF